MVRGEKEGNRSCTRIRGEVVDEEGVVEDVSRHDEDVVRRPCSSLGIAPSPCEPPFMVSEGFGKGRMR